MLTMEKRTPSRLRLALRFAAVALVIAGPVTLRAQEQNGGQRTARDGATGYRSTDSSDLVK